MHITPSKRYQQSQPEERMTIASFLRQQYSLTQIATLLKRLPSTISRKLKHNTQDLCYASQAATTCTCQRRRQRRPAKKLHTEGTLFGVVHHFFNQRWSPEQIALTLASIYPKGHEDRVSTETIYNCIYSLTVGQLHKDLIQALRHAQNKRVPRSKRQDSRWQIPDMLSIHLRPPQIEDRLFPGHWEGDFIKGAANASAVGTLVGRTSRLVLLVKLPECPSLLARPMCSKALQISCSALHSPCARA